MLVAVLTCSVFVSGNACPKLSLSVIHCWLQMLSDGNRWWWTETVLLRKLRENFSGWMPVANCQWQMLTAEDSYEDRGKQGTPHEGSAIVCGCFILTARWKDGLFLQLSPWRNPRLRHVACSFGTSRKKHQPLSRAQPNAKRARSGKMLRRGIR